MRRLYVIPLLASLLAGCTTAPLPPAAAPVPAVAMRPASPNMPVPSATGAIQYASPEAAARLRLLLDQVLTEDSKSWLLNRYDRSSVTSAITVKHSDKLHALLIGAGYTINRGQRMVIIAVVQNGHIACIATSDFPGACRQIGHPPSHQIARAIAGANRQPAQASVGGRPLLDSCHDAGNRQAMDVALDSSCSLGDVLDSAQAEDERESENRDAMNDGDPLPHPDSDIAPEE